MAFFKKEITSTQNTHPMRSRTPTAKVVILGGSSVGKTSIITKYMTNTFVEGDKPTIGAAYVARECNLGTYSIKLEIWDTAGQERFQSVAPTYYRNALAAIVVYDLTNAASFERAKDWVSTLKQIGRTNVLITLVGNKSDLLVGAELNRAVPKDEVDSFVKESTIFRSIETSAFLGSNIVQLFIEIAKGIPLESIQRSNEIKRLIVDNDGKPDTFCAC